MAEYYEREKIIEALPEMDSFYIGCKLVDVPSIDIVRCSECKYIGFPKYRDNIFVCNITGFTIEGNDYCSRGEKKE